jgi:hypothetical protein
MVVMVVSVVIRIDDGKILLIKFKLSKINFLKYYYFNFFFFLEVRQDIIVTGSDDSDDNELIDDFAKQITCIYFQNYM